MFSLISFVISNLFYSIPTGVYLTQLAPTLLAIAVSLYLFSAFEVTLEASLASLLSRNLLAVFVALAIMLVVIYFLGPGSIRNIYGRGVLLLSLAIFTAYLLVTRYFRFRFLRKRKPFNQWVFLGSKSNFKKVQQAVKGLKRHKIEYRDYQDLSDIALEKHDTGIIIDDNIYSSSELTDQLIQKKFLHGHITSIDLFYENYLEKIPIFHIKDYWIISNSGFGMINSSIRQRVKRTIDIVLVLVTLPITLLVGAVSALVIFVYDRKTPFFTQKRVGWHGRVFTIYKLRTMSEKMSTSDGEWTTNNDSRVTTVGRILRRYRIDEFPQLINVLKGDMSIIGPRPEQPSYTKLLEEEIPYYDIRHSVKPGITGWAQVKFPYGSSVNDSRDKLEYDIYYIKNYSLLLDLTILIKTTYTIVSGGGR